MKDEKDLKIKANKGEWAEFYAFLKILEDKKLPAANKNLETYPDKFFIFRKIIRSETNQKEKIFDLSKEGIEILNSEGILIKKIENSTIGSKTKNIFDKIKNSPSKATTFHVLEAEELMDELLCTQIKASNSRKSDIDAIIVDRASNKEELLGFSVKSIIGGASTLLNAGRTTNFSYLIEGLSPELIDAVNKIESRSKIQDRLKFIINQGAKVTFSKVLKPEFETNLRIIDAMFPLMISNMLIEFFKGRASKITDLVDLLYNENEQFRAMYGLSRSVYDYKMKIFLESIALGMVPSKEWSGFIKAQGGYIVVRNDGSVVCYHLYNREEFLSYLYENTKFESAGSSRHDYGKVYVQDGKVYFNLNLQVRFLK